MASVSNDWFVCTSDQPGVCPTRQRNAWVRASAWSSASSVQIESTYTATVFVLGGSPRAARDAKPAESTKSSNDAVRMTRLIHEKRSAMPPCWSNLLRPASRCRFVVPERVHIMRITGGIYRSRTLRAPHGSSTRPTSDRVREGLFGILSAAAAIEGRRVLDLYAGTGRWRSKHCHAGPRTRSSSNRRGPPSLPCGPT